MIDFINEFKLHFIAVIINIIGLTVFIYSILVIVKEKNNENKYSSKKLLASYLLGLSIVMIIVPWLVILILNKPTMFALLHYKQY